MVLNGVDYIGIKVSVTVDLYFVRILVDGFAETFVTAGIIADPVRGQLIGRNAADLDRTGFSVNRKGFILIAIGVDGCLQYAVTAIFDLKEGKSDILCFNVRMV